MWYGGIMDKPLLLLMVGLPGSGKTTFARQLGARYGVIVLTADAIRVAIIDDPQWDATEHRYFFGMLNLVSTLLLASGYSVLHDANHNRLRVRDTKYVEAAQAGANAAVIYMKLSESVQTARTAARVALGGTEVIPAKKMKITPDEMFERLSANFEPPSTKEPIIVLDGGADFETQLAGLQHGLAGRHITLPPKHIRKPKLYMMLGLPGSGKTTAATGLALLTRAVHLSSDAFRLAMFPKPTFSETEHELLYDALDHLTELLLLQGVDVIYDANLNRKHHRQEKYDICQKFGIEYRLLWVQTSQVLAQARRVADSHDMLRPPYESPEAMFRRIASIFETPNTQQEPFTVLDGTKISASYLRHTLGLA